MHPTPVHYNSITLFFLISFLILTACSGPSDDAPTTQSSNATETIKALPVVPDAEKPDIPAPEAEKTVTDKHDAIPGIIPMKSPIYATHTKGIVLFSHEKHCQTYQIGCGECHHDAQGNPTNDYKPSDATGGCSECHSNPGKAPKPVDGKKLSLKEKLVYHSEALHENCITCHKAHNTKTSGKSAPTSCAACHPKEK